MSDRLWNLATTGNIMLEPRITNFILFTHSMTLQWALDNKILTVCTCLKSCSNLCYLSEEDSELWWSVDWSVYVAVQADLNFSWDVSECTFFIRLWLLCSFEPLHWGYSTTSFHGEIRKILISSHLEHWFRPQVILRMQSFCMQADLSL